MARGHQLLFLCLIHTIAPAMSASTPTLELLSAVFKHDTEILLAPGTAEYEEETCVYWNVANREIRPQAIVRPKTSEEAA